MTIRILISCVYLDLSHLAIYILYSLQGLPNYVSGYYSLPNIAQRLASSCICFFFLLSGLVLGPAELLGHIPIFCAAIILLLNPAPALNLFKNYLWSLKCKCINIRPPMYFCTIGGLCLLIRASLTGVLKFLSE